MLLLLFDEGAAGGVGAVPQPVEGVVGVAGRRRQLVRGGLDEPDLHDVRLPLDAGLYMLPALSLVIVSAVQLPASTFSISMYSRKTLKLYLLYPSIICWNYFYEFKPLYGFIESHAVQLMNL